MIDPILSFIPGAWLAWGGIIIAALSAMWFGGRKSAKTDAKVETMKDEVQGYEVRNEVDNRVAAERDAKRKLHDSWGR